jgi:hypothetical protein
MQKLKNKLLLLIGVSLFFMCCAPVIIKPTLQDVDQAKQKWTDVTLDQLNKGYSLYVAKCGSCHFLYKPTKFTEREWLEMFPKMKIKAKIDDEQIDLIMKYIITKCNSSEPSNKK